MPSVAVVYESIKTRKRQHTQAVRVWTTAVIVALVWVGFIIAPPLLIAAGYEGAATSIYHVFSYVCHQKPERSFYIAGYPFAVCSRCFGVYFGVLAGFASYPLWRKVDDIEPLPRLWLFLSIIPIGIDWLLGVTGIWENNQASRFFTGMILGFACAVYIMPAAVEIARNLRGSVRNK